MSKASPQPEPRDHRARPRSSREDRTTNLVQTILTDPQRAAAQLEGDLHRGADLQVVLGLLDAAEQAGERRGVTMAPLVGAIRSRILRKAWSSHTLDGSKT